MVSCVDEERCAGFHFFSHDGSNDSSVHQIFNNHVRHDAAAVSDGDKQTNQEIGAMMSEAFKRLTLKERQETQDSFHGVDVEIVENIASIDQSLRNLETHLMRVKSGSVYEQAEKMDPVYVRSRAFRVMFLRGNRYDAKATAAQMIRFFKIKKELFGSDKVVKNITIEDLDEDARECLRSGCMQIICKDTSNRPILLQVPSLIPSLSTQGHLQSALRARYFVATKLLETEEAQRRGVVTVTSLLGQYKDSRNGKGNLDFHCLLLAMPLHTVAFHVCTDDWAQAAICNTVLRMFSPKEVARFRLHLGTHLECEYLLSTYGIPASLLPLIPEPSMIHLSPHQRWYQKCIANSDGNDRLIARALPIGPITEPNPDDVLFAGSKKFEGAGNGRLRELVRNRAEAYQSSSYEEKRRMVDHIIDAIHEAGGRFLQQEKKSLVWIEVSTSKVRLKMTQRFRNHIRRQVSESQPGFRVTAIVDTALPKDVIFGRAQITDGNALFHRLIKDRSDEYEALNRGMKIVILDWIIEQVKRGGGRFLEPTRDLDDRYVELPTDGIRERIATYFRNHRRSRKKQNMR